MNVKNSPSAKMCSAELINSLKRRAIATLSDVMGRWHGAWGWIPFHKEGYMAGTAVAVRTIAGDNLALHVALTSIRPGDILLGNRGGLIFVP